MFQSSDAKSRRFHPGPRIFFLALAFQIAVVLQLVDSWHFPPSANDTAFYVDWARHLRGEIPWQPRQINSPGTAFYGMPGYAYTLAGIFSVTGGYQQERSPVIIALLQTIAQAGTACILFLLGQSLFPEKSPASSRGFWLGALAAILWMLFIPAQIFSAIALPVIWVTAGFWAIFASLAPSGKSGPISPKKLLGIGGALGLLAMLAASVLLLVILICVATVSNLRAMERGKRWPSLFSSLGLLLTGLFLGASPCWVHNFVLARDPVLFSAHDGVNFYLGNHPGADGYTHIPAELPSSQRELLDRSIEIAEREIGESPLPRSAVSRFWKERALSWISQEPLAWLRLEFRKIDNFWNAFQYDDLSVVRPLRAEERFLPGVQWAHLAPFALAGLLSLRRWPHLKWVAGAVLLVMLGLLPVFITERYRLLAAPGLILLAVAGWVWAWEKIHQRAVLATLAYGIVLAGAALWTTLPRPPSLWSLDHYNEGVRCLDLARGVSETDAVPLLRRAQEALETALAYAPRDSNVLLALGNLWLSRGNHEHALSCLERSVAANQINFHAQGNLGYVYGALHRWSDAIPPLATAAALDPGNPQRWVALAKAKAQVGRMAEAQSAIQTALALKPGDPELIELARTFSPK